MVQAADKSIEQEKGTPPLLSERERALLLSSVESVDRVIIFDDSDASHLIRVIRPSKVVKGERHRKNTMIESEAIQDVGASLEFFEEY